MSARHPPIPPPIFFSLPKRRVPTRARSAAKEAATHARRLTSGTPFIPFTPFIPSRLVSRRKYEAKFGHIFIICASGKPAGEILAALKERYPNSPYAELGVTAGEQQKITEIRLEKLGVEMAESGERSGDASARRLTHLGAHVTGSDKASPPPAPPSKRSPVTTHVLDTSRGRPAEGIPVTLETVDTADGSRWSVSGVTDGDGRVGNLLAADHALQPGHYVITFDCGGYVRATTGLEGFYPHVPIHFVVKPSQAREHYHVPLLLNPFGYSTYRGS